MAVTTQVRVCRTSMAPRSRFGFTLLEAVVVLAIMTVVTAMAAQLIMAARARLVISGQEATKPAVESVIARLRADIQSSSSFDGHTGTLWGSEPMLLRGHSSGYGIVYEIEDGMLLRSAVDLLTGDTVAEPRPVLADVDSFRWRRHPDLAYGAIEIELKINKAHQATARYSGSQIVASEHQHSIEMLVMPRRVVRSRI